MSKEQERIAAKTKGRFSYQRDIWCLGPSSNGYKGAFPRGFVSRLEKENFWGTKRLWLFSGSFKDEGQTTVDIKTELNPTVVANCEQLPFADESFDFVCADPPYSEKEAKELYNLPYFNIIKVVNEAARVLKPNGYFVFLHRLIPMHHPSENQHKKQLKLVALIGVFTIAGYSNLRALSVWKKEAKL